MIRLLTFRHQGHTYELLATAWNGTEQLLVDGNLVSERQNEGLSGQHTFSLPDGQAQTLQFRLELTRLTWRLSTDESVIAEGDIDIRPEASQPKPARSAGSHWIAIGGTFFKLFKSAGAVKVALAGTAFAGYTLLFSWQFAVMLLAIIVFHEYGHVRAMKRCGLPTKGIYLIPFFGGVAVGDKARTFWQEVYISMMGPVFGLVMSVVFWLAYLTTGIELLGLVATFSALINLFNLLPVYPLDGGHVLKAIVFSSGKAWSWVLLVGISAAGFAASVAVGLYLISFFLVLGAIDLVGTRNEVAAQQTVPMDRYGMAVSLAWYVAVVVVFIVIILHMAGTGVPGSEIPLMILKD